MSFREPPLEDDDDDFSPRAPPPKPNALNCCAKFPPRHEPVRGGRSFPPPRQLPPPLIPLPPLLPPVPPLLRNALPRLWITVSEHSEWSLLPLLLWEEKRRGYELL